MSQVFVPTSIVELALLALCAPPSPLPRPRLSPFPRLSSRRRTPTGEGVPPSTPNSHFSVPHSKLPPTAGGTVVIPRLCSQMSGHESARPSEPSVGCPLPPYRPLAPQLDRPDRAAPPPRLPHPRRPRRPHPVRPTGPSPPHRPAPPPTHYPGHPWFRAPPGTSHC